MVTIVNTPTIIKDCKEVADTLEARGDKIDAMTVKAAIRRLDDLLFERNDLLDQIRILKEPTGER